MLGGHRQELCTAPLRGLRQPERHRAVAEAALDIRSLAHGPGVCSAGAWGADSGCTGFARFTRDPWEFDQ